MKFLFFIFNIIFPVILFSQTVKVSENISIKNESYYEIIGKMKDNILLLKGKGYELTVQGLNEQMNISWEKELDLDKKRPQMIGLVRTGKDFSIFYKYRKQAHSFLKVNKYNAAANLIDSLTIKDFGGVFYMPELEFDFSENKRFVLLYSFEFANKIRALVFDLLNMEIVLEKTFNFEEVILERDFLQFIITNSGDVLVIFEKYNRKGKLPEHHFLVFEYGPSFEKVFKYRIPFPEHLTYDVYFKYDNLNKKLKGGGLFADNHRGKTSGFFIITEAQENPIVSTYFNDEFVLEFSDKEKGKNKGIEDVEIKDIVLREDGGALLFGEKYRSYSKKRSSYPDSFRNYSRKDYPDYSTDHYHDNVFVISIHPDGKEHWINILDKKQYSRNEDSSYSSFFMMKSNRRIHIIFNDEIRFENTVSEYVLNGNGDKQRNSILNTKDQQLRLRLQDAMQVSANELIIPSDRKNKLKLVNIKF